MGIAELAKFIHGCDIPEKLIEAYLPQAKCKLERIINNEGDCGGKRREPFYLAQLVIEEIQAAVLAARCAGHNS